MEEPVTIACIGHAAPERAEAASAYDDDVLALLADQGAALLYRGRRAEAQDPGLRWRCTSSPSRPARTTTRTSGTSAGSRWSNDPATVVTLEISDSAVADAENPFGGGGGDEFGATVDLRGTATSVIGATPALLEEYEIEEVPVLASVLIDPNMEDSCGTPHRPASGSDLEVAGVAMEEGGETFVYTGACSGSLTILAGPEPGSTPAPDRSPLVPVAIGGAGLLVVGLIAGGVLWRPRRDGE